LQYPGIVTLLMFGVAMGTTMEEEKDAG